MGDSLFAQCGDSLGVGDRSLGMVGWWGGTTRDMRWRMSSTAEDWPYMSEPSHADELAGFRDAASWVIGLGTNDVRLLTIDQFRANVAWFMEQSRGRPVLWFTIVNPYWAENATRFNAVLGEAASRHPNLRVIDWNRFVADHPSVLSDDRIHLGSWEQGCKQGRLRLIAENLPSAGDTTTSGPDAYGVPPTSSPVTTRYEELGGEASPLGPATGPLVCSSKNDGCAQIYEGGAIYWSAATGAHVVSQPDILDRWSSYFAEMGPLGYPVADTVCGLRGGGCEQHFETGSFHWSPTTGAYRVISTIHTNWGQQGWEDGWLGYPTVNTICDLRDGGCLQHFQGGSIYWSPTTGAHPLGGAIRATWAQRGWENGWLGYPTTGEYPIPTGVAQRFQGGTLTFRTGTTR